MFVSEILPVLVCVQQTDWKVSGINMSIPFPNAALQISVLLNTIFTLNWQSASSPFPKFPPDYCSVRASWSILSSSLLSPIETRPKAHEAQPIDVREVFSPSPILLRPWCPNLVLHFPFWICRLTNWFIFDCRRATCVLIDMPTMSYNLNKVAWIEAKALSISLSTFVVLTPFHQISNHQTHYFSTDNPVLRTWLCMQMAPVLCLIWS